MVGDSWWKYCMRTSRSAPSAVFAHHERPSPCSYPAAAASISADTAAISSAVNTSAMWRKPASARKCPIARGSSSVWKARARSSGCPSVPVKVDRAGRVHRPRVDQAAQDHPPVEEVLEPACRHVEVAAGEQAHRRAEVVHDVGQVLLPEPHVRRRAPATRGHGHATVVERERPGPAVDLHRERPRRELTAPGGDERSPLARQARELLVEEPAWVDRRDIGCGSGAHID